MTDLKEIDLPQELRHMPDRQGGVYSIHYLGEGEGTVLEWDGRTAAALLADDAAEAADQCGLGDILLAKNAKERQEKVEAYRTHVNRMNLLGGHSKPLVMHIKGEVENRGVRWTQHKHTTAVLAGAI